MSLKMTQEINLGRCQNTGDLWSEEMFHKIKTDFPALSHIKNEEIKFYVNKDATQMKKRG